MSLTMLSRKAIYIGLLAGLSILSVSCRQPGDTPSQSSSSGEVEQSSASVVANRVSCPKAAVVEKATTVTPVTKANYAAAETEVIFAEYVRKIAKGTCGTGVGEF